MGGPDLLIGVVVGVLGSVIAAEACAWCSFLAEKLVRRHARHLPSELSIRYLEEWLAELNHQPGSAGKLWFALALYRAVPQIRDTTLLPLRAGADDLTIARVRDILLAGCGLCLAAPLWILIAIIIKLEDRGPIFCSQERVGMGGRRFRSLKFRCMVPDVDSGFESRLIENWRDDRLTRIGRFLRATALDCLPLLWNIFKGSMSFVGPWALMPTETVTKESGETIPVEKVPGYVERLQVRPGITGIAQVYAPHDLPRRFMFRYDLAYIQNQSLWLDMKLILLSFWITFQGKWEARARKY